MAMVSLGLLALGKHYSHVNLLMLPATPTRSSEQVMQLQPEKRTNTYLFLTSH